MDTTPRLKKIKLLYVNLIAIAFLLPSFGVLAPDVFRGAGGGLYAQDPELFNHTWYFENGEIDGENFYPLPYLNGELDFYSNIISIYHPYCEDAQDAGIQYDGVDPFFLLHEDGVILSGVCSNPDETEFMSKHYGIYRNGVDYNNPFTYNIAAVNNYYQLTIENDDGDWAVYNSVLLSTSGFTQNSFGLYPNPAREILYISKEFDQSVQASIYDLSGKLLQSNVVEVSQTNIDIRQLNAGLYFVVFESEAGERVSKKFVKQ